MQRIVSMALILALSLLYCLPANATLIYANSVDRLLRGDTTIGNFAGFYGGSFPGAFPVELTAAQAEAAVLGAPDGDFLSLPGRNDTPTGSAFPYAYVEVSFGTTFDYRSDIIITELGNSAESALVWLFSEIGGFVNLSITRGADDNFVIDLSPYAAFNAAQGAFTSVGIGGLDLLGASYGFDLDAVALNKVPTPGTLLLLGIGLLGMGLARREGRR